MKQKFKNYRRENGKIKVGTVLDKANYQRLKERAAREHRPVSDVLNEAVAAYTAPVSENSSERSKAFERMMSHAIKISRAELDEIMEMDPYDL